MALYKSVCHRYYYPTMKIGLAQVAILLQVGTGTDTMWRIKGASPLGDRLTLSLTVLLIRDSGTV